MPSSAGGGCARLAAVVVPARAGAGCVWLRLRSVVAASAEGAGSRLVLWPGPREPHCVAGVSGGRGGSPAAVPER